MTLISLGDSHALYNFAGIAEAKIFWCGPVTMHRAARDGIWSLVPRNYRARDTDLIILSFGEIDSRAHLKKQAVRNGRDSLDEARILMDRFEKALGVFRATCKAQIGLSCILPFNPALLECEYYATRDECEADARRLRRYMNERLSKMGVVFVDFREAFSNGDGTLKLDMSDRNVHIDPRCAQLVIDALKTITGQQFTYEAPPSPDPRSRAEPPYRSPLKQLQLLTRPIRRALKHVVRR